MAAGNFEKCHEVTARWEGGWSNHPDDPGGKTMYGVTEAVYHAWLRSQGKPKKSVRYITRSEALAIYKSEYWRAAKCEGLAPGVDLAVYDASVNSGVSRGRKWLMASIGGSDVQTVQRVCAKRLGFMQSLAIWKTFGKGWSRRVADIEAKGVAWALAAVTNKNVTQKSLEREADKANKKSATQAAGGAATGSGGSVVSVDQADQLAGWALGVVLAVVFVIAAILIIRSVRNKHRAEAYAKEALAQ